MVATDLNQLCLKCGLCCDGTIFADGQLQPEDDPDQLRALGLVLKRSTKGGGAKFRQPCAALNGCRCEVYADRPRYCREFECLLFKDVAAGEIELSTAQGMIRSARRRVARVKRLLRALNDSDEQAPLASRFRRIQKHFEQNTPDRESAAVYGELTLAMHDLHVLLSESFYRG